MNREIKFRAYDSECRDMLYSDYDFDEIDINGEYTYYRGSNGDSERFKNKNLMQYTGLEDKNGLEIYNGDIVQIPYIDPVGHIHYGTDGKKIVVEFENGMFGFHTNTKFCPLENYIGKTKGEYVPNHGNKTMYGDFIGKVIGNKYENPELINNK